MSEPPSDARTRALAARLEALRGRYAFRFADKPRATRDLAELDLLVKELESTAAELEALGGEDVEPLRKTAADLLAAWRVERSAVVEARAAGPEFGQAALLGSRANFAIARYHRHFAGQDRRTRDLALLHEIVSDLEDLQHRMARVLARTDVPALRDDLEVVTEDLAIYRREAEAIALAQAAGTPAERASLLAHLANRQFEVYKVHFAGHARLTRRPELLERTVEELRRISAAMNALAREDYIDETNIRNIEIVAERRRFYEAERAKIAAERDRTTVPRLVEALAGEAARIMSEYNEHFAGEDRSSRDLEHLGVLCERMAEIERQHDDLARRFDIDPLHGALGLVRDSLALLESEYEAVRKARLN